MAITHRALTLEQFLELPEQEPALEYLDGMVTRKMSPKGPHGTLQGRMYLRFEQFGEAHSSARAFPETRTTYAGASFVPDLVVYRSERVPSDDRGNIPEEFQTPPDIAVEIWSPGQTLGDLVARCRWYVEHGVSVALFVHPRRRWVRVFRPGAELGPFSSPARIDLGDVLPGFEPDLAELFRWLRARPD